MRRTLTLLAGATLISAAPVAAQAPLKTLTKPDVEYAEPFTQINGVRELRDGRVIVADVREKTVQIVDLKAGTAQKVWPRRILPARPLVGDAWRHVGRLRSAQSPLPRHRT